MLRGLVVVIGIGLSGCAGTGAVLLRYRLREGERYFTEMRTVRVGPPSVQIVVRARTEVGAGLRLHNELVTLGAFLDGRRVEGVAAPGLVDQRVTADRRRVVSLADDDARAALFGPRLPLRRVSVGRSWQERRADPAAATTTWLRETLVAIEDGTCVIALRGTIRTELDTSARVGPVRALVSSLAGERRIDLANGWVGRSEVEVVTSLRVRAEGRETAGRTERSRIVLRVAREPFGAGLSE